MPGPINFGYDNIKNYAQSGLNAAKSGISAVGKAVSMGAHHVAPIVGGLVARGAFYENAPGLVTKVCVAGGKYLLGPTLGQKVGGYVGHAVALSVMGHVINPWTAGAATFAGGYATKKVMDIASNFFSSLTKKAVDNTKQKELPKENVKVEEEIIVEGDDDDFVHLPVAS
ncbi:hypothetical protein BN1013_01901 [Candidatus Rubidus massiliensis]|nr:hypothetical protein BN1013_01901 [Candidatus Rubidus massiliensis]